MGWSFDRFLKSQMGLLQRLIFFRKPIGSLKKDLTPLEMNSIEELMYGFGWAADMQMRRVTETDCLSILVVAPERIVIGAGELTEELPYEVITGCYWDGEDLCIRFKDGVADVPGVRFQAIGDRWTPQRRSGFVNLVMKHVEDTSPLGSGADELGAADNFVGGVRS